jgi:hypothetical protein
VKRKAIQMRYDAIIALDELKNENNQAGQEQNM